MIHGESVGVRSTGEGEVRGNAVQQKAQCEVCSAGKGAVWGNAVQQKAQYEVRRAE